MHLRYPGVSVNQPRSANVATPKRPSDRLRRLFAIACTGMSFPPTVVADPTLFIARQHAMHDQRDTVLANLSVDLTLVMYRNKCT